MIEKVVMVEADSYKEALKKFQAGQYRDIAEAQPEEKEAYKVEVDGNKTIVTTKDGKVGVARCNPSDEFDLVEGYTSSA